MRIHLGLDPDQFFALIPRQFHLLVDQHDIRVRHDELLTGILASAIVNWSMRAPKEPSVPADFMPSRRGAGRLKKKSSRRSNGQRVSDDIRSWLDQMRVAGRVVTAG